MGRRAKPPPTDDKVEQTQRKEREKHETPHAAIPAELLCGGYDALEQAIGERRIDQLILTGHDLPRERLWQVRAWRGQQLPERQQSGAGAWPGLRLPEQRQSRAGAW